MHHCTLMLHTHIHINTYAPLQRGVIIFKELFINLLSPGKTKSLSRQRFCAIWSPTAVGKVPECFTSLLMNIWATQQLTLSDHIFFSSSCCCCAWYGSDVFIRLSKRKCLQLWRIPPEPVTLLVSMAVLQAAPQAGCVQGPIQPVFSAAAPLMFSPRAGVKLPSAERENSATFLCHSSVLLYKEIHSK